ncbi:hypothetical protein [Tateyamaria sp. ANG-S1]|uniref:hypothetical protein n=1 Tax=Tateyamaria sp. ANG-S1 TaxID=1577905 RepID=UPI00057D2756|nr:hypothetical protein [Tateyamaria sp. ANG-S1]KIC49834.1 hypothetical protein RA29_09340 [Tateyamaria sp. ANG-S1]
MRYLKEIATGVATLAIAVGIGFVMQSGEAAKERYGAAARNAPAPVDETFTGTSGTDILLEVQEIELTSASDPAAVPVPQTDSNVQRVSVPATTDRPEESDFLPRAAGCEMRAEAQVGPAAMVLLSLAAPCAANERLTVHHNGMMFTETTDASGNLNLTVPALSEQAVFIMAFSNGDGAVAQANVPDVAQYDRTTLQWRGQAGFELHAREFGASYGQNGHVWSGTSQNIEGMMTGENGYLMRLGDTQLDEPLMAEIYTYPSGTSAKSGTIDLSVEAEVTLNNCGMEVEAQSLEIMADGAMKTQDLTLAVPGCDAVGSFLVLNNLVADLKVASN